MENCVKTNECKKSPELIAYSYLMGYDLPPNSAEFFEQACKLDFDYVKGDVAVTKDKKLIMCHDYGFLFDENGRFCPPTTVEEEEAADPITNYTYDECMKIEYSQASSKNFLGYYAKLTDLETFIAICKKYNKKAYIVLREIYIDDITKQTYDLLVKYDMVDKCIINSFSYDTLKAMRVLDPCIRLSHVFDPNIPLEKSHVDEMLELGGDVILCAFWYNLAEWLCEASREAMDYAKEKGVAVHLARAYNLDWVNAGTEYGFSGFQCMHESTIEKTK